MRFLGKTQSGGAALFFVLFWSAITLLFDCVIVYGIFCQIRSKFYPQTTGTVLASRVEVESGSDGNSYVVKIEYRYVVNDRVLFGKRYAYGMMSSSSNAQAIVDAHPAGSTTPVHFNPNDPSDAVLSTDVGAMSLMIMMFMTPFNLIMLAGWFAIFSAGKKSSGRSVALQTVNDGSTRRARLVEISPFLAALIALGASTFGGTFVAAFGVLATGAGEWAMVLIWAIVLAICAYVYHRRKTYIDSGAMDVVVDVNTVTLPLRCKRTLSETIARKDIHAIEIETVSTKDSDGGTSNQFAPTIGYTDAAGNAHAARIDEFTEQADAEEMAAWLRSELNIQPASATSSV